MGIIEVKCVCYKDFGGYNWNWWIYEDAGLPGMWVIR